MGRQQDPKARNRVREHKVGRYRYAGILVPTGEGKERRLRYRHLGRLTDTNQFVPNTTFRYMDRTERNELEFPTEWDLSLVKALPSERSAGRPAYTGDDRTRFYGDIWLLEQIARVTGLRDDLITVFGGNKEKALDVLTIAMFYCLTGEPDSHLAAWQELGRFPSDHELTSSVITRLTQSIQDKHRMALFRLRCRRLGTDELCCLDSTSRSAYGHTLADIAWGKNKEGVRLPQTNEAVVYSLDSSLPVYYRTMPGNMPDIRSFKTILADLDLAGLRNLILITDRGYESQYTLAEAVRRRQKLLTATNLRRKQILKHLDDFGDFGGRPREMEWIPGWDVYGKQYPYELKVTLRGGESTQAQGLFLNLYFDSELRGVQQKALDSAVYEQEIGIRNAQKSGLPFEAADRRQYKYLTITVDPETQAITNWERNEKHIRRDERLMGFFANITNELKLTPGEALTYYKARDEQEKYFELMKTSLGKDRQHNWSESAKTGALFILFVALILLCWIRHAWKTTKLRELYPYTHAIFLDMRRIRCTEQEGRAKIISPFIGNQLKVCEILGFQVPAGCETPSTRC